MATNPASGRLQPLAVQLLKGADKKNPKRYAERKNSVQPKRPIGSPPDWLSDEARDVWREVQSECVPGVLTVQDRQAFAVFCALLADFRTPSVHPAWATGLYSRGVKIMQMAAQFGLTPVARQKVAAGGGEEDARNFGEFN